jgi:hypothetical protein
MTKRKSASDEQASDDNRNLIMQHWLKFESELAEGSDGSEELFDLLFESPFRKCSKCHSADVVRMKERRYIWCSGCAHKTSLTAGTFFHNARRPKVWLGAIRLMELGLEFSARMLSLVAKAAYDTAWEILKKIDAVLKKNLDSQALFLPSKVFEKVFLKRSRETPAREHPRIEQRVAEREQASSLTINLASIDKREQMILAVIGEQVVEMDFICEQTMLPPAEVSARLMMMELSGLIERLEGDRFRRKFSDGAIAKPCRRLKKLAKKFIKYLKSFMRGSSRKYVHLYVARFWCIIDRDRWANGNLLKECLHSHRFPRAALRLENAPLMVPLPRLVA